MDLKKCTISIETLFVSLETFIASYNDNSFSGMDISHVATLVAFLGGIHTDDVEFNKAVEMRLYSAIKDVPELVDNFDFIFNDGITVSRKNKGVN